jgi:hypothetical protein
MAMEDKFDGAKTAFGFYFAYLNAVAQEMGMEKATALNAKVDETLGTMQGRMMKEQAGIKEFDAKTAGLQASDAIAEALGIRSEMIEGTPQKAVMKCGRCPVYEAAQMGGLDAKTIETLCRDGSLKFMDAMVKQLNPNLSYKLKKFRSAADDFCEEEIVLA